MIDRAPTVKLSSLGEPKSYPPDNIDNHPTASIAEISSPPRHTDLNSFKGKLDRRFMLSREIRKIGPLPEALDDI